MASFDFPPLTKYVSFTYRCPYCNEISDSDAFEVPSPNYAGDNQSESENWEEYDCCCEHCGEAIRIDLINGMYGGTLQIDDLENQDLINPIYEEEEDLDEANYGFYTDAHKALDAIDSLSEDTKSTLYRLLYANAIAYLEAYLSDNIKTLAVQDKASIRLFVENCHDFSERKVELKNIFIREEGLKKEILEYLDSLIYHKLPKIKELYHDCLGIDMGNIQELVKSVLVRHDIVHRNGKTKDGKDVSISKADVEKVWDNVFTMIKCIDSQKANKMLDDLFDEKSDIDLGF